MHLAVRVTSSSEIVAAEEAMSEVLIRRHALPEGYPEDFSTQDQASILKEGQAATTTFKALTFALGGISLLVGGIGIMNMMLVSVHERTREIGIRKSVGASPFMVQAQFLIEAIVLSTLGGIVGVLAGVGATHAIGAFAGWETLIAVPTLHRGVRRRARDRAPVRLLPGPARLSAGPDHSAPLRVMEVTHGSADLP